MTPLDQIAPAFIEMAHSIVWASAATVDADSRPRTRILFRAALRGQKVRLSVEGAPGPRPPAVVARELVCLAFVPFQLLRLRHAARARSAAR